MKEKGILEMAYIRDCRFWTYDNQRRNSIGNSRKEMRITGTIPGRRNCQYCRKEVLHWGCNVMYRLISWTLLMGL